MTRDERDKQLRAVIDSCDDLTSLDDVSHEFQRLLLSKFREMLVDKQSDVDYARKEMDEMYKMMSEEKEDLENRISDLEESVADLQGQLERAML